MWWQLLAGSVVFVPESLPYGSDNHETQLFDMNPADWANTVENQKALSKECDALVVSVPPASLPSDATSDPQVRFGHSWVVQLFLNEM